MHNRKQALLSLLLIGLALTGLATAQEPRVIMPDTVYAWGDSLQFVSLKRAVFPDGRVDTAFLKNSTADSIQRLLDQTPGEDGCVTTTGQLSLDSPSGGKESTEGALRTSDHVLIGRVLGLKAGFQSRLGYLVAIETEEVLAGVPRPKFYLFFPKGRIEFQGRSYCVAHDAYPDLPAVGDRLLVMHQEQIHGSLLGIFSTQLILLPEAGAPSLGRSVASRRPGEKRLALSFESNDQVVAWAKQMLDGATQ